MLGTRPAVKDDIASDRPLYHTGCDGEMRSYYYNWTCLRCNKSWSASRLVSYSPSDLAARFYVKAIAHGGEHIMVERTVGKDRVTMCILKGTEQPGDVRVRSF